jgi:hypothetical protein
MGTLTHEIVHPMLEADFPGAPEWLEEGIASPFEAPVLAARRDRGRSRWVTGESRKRLARRRC